MASHKQDGITEAAAVNLKRGRPPVFGAEARATVTGLFPETKTHRGVTDTLYRLRAVNLLSKDIRFAWVADAEKMRAGAPRAWKPSILTELGRIPDDDVLRAVALRICELKPKTKDAVAMIRHARLGRAPERNYIGLFEHLHQALLAYLVGHPSTPADWPARALRDLADCIEAEYT